MPETKSRSILNRTPCSLYVYLCRRSRHVPGPGQYAWAEKDRPHQPGGRFGQAAQVGRAWGVVVNRGLALYPRDTRRCPCPCPCPCARACWLAALPLSPRGSLVTRWPRFVPFLKLRLPILQNRQPDIATPHRLLPYIRHSVHRRGKRPDPPPASTPSRAPWATR